MFVGDELPAPGPLMPEQAREAAAMLPPGLRVETEGTSAGRLVLLAAGLLVLALFGLVVAYSTFPYPTTSEWLASLAAIIGTCAAVGAVAYRAFIKHRKEFRLDEEGIVVHVRYPAEARPWTTHIPWTEIEDYTVSITPGAAMLRVASVHGYALTLHDRPARLSTREIIRRFAEQAERYPRATPPVSPHEPGYVPSAIVDAQNVSIRGCLTSMGVAMVFIVGFPIIRLVIDFPEFSRSTRIAAFAAVVLLAGGWWLWTALEDSDVAMADRDSRKRIARLRRWLRRVLGIRMT